MPSSIWRPPAASGPVRTVRKPTRIGSGCPCAKPDDAVATTAPTIIDRKPSHLRNMYAPLIKDRIASIEIELSSMRKALEDLVRLGSQDASRNVARQHQPVAGQLRGAGAHKIDVIFVRTVAFLERWTGVIVCLAFGLG